jgi:hypothetical protein
MDGDVVLALNIRLPAANTHVVLKAPKRLEGYLAGEPGPLCRMEGQGTACRG